uniref:hypothetical protein n=1 Tax=Cronobacter malonaticus TaxID=413503 RepID=UPI001F3BF2D7
IAEWYRRLDWLHNTHLLPIVDFSVQTNVINNRKGCIHNKSIKQFVFLLVLFFQSSKGIVGGFTGMKRGLRPRH